MGDYLPRYVTLKSKWKQSKLSTYKIYQGRCCTENVFLIACCLRKKHNS